VSEFNADQFKEILKYNRSYATAINNKDGPKTHYEEFKTKFEEKLPLCCNGRAANGGPEIKQIMPKEADRVPSETYVTATLLFQQELKKKNEAAKKGNKK